MPLTDKKDKKEKDQKKKKSTYNILKVTPHGGVPFSAAANDGSCGS